MKPTFGDAEKASLRSGHPPGPNPFPEGLLDLSPGWWLGEDIEDVVLAALHAPEESGGAKTAVLTLLRQSRAWGLMPVGERRGWPPAWTCGELVFQAGRDLPLRRTLELPPGSWSDEDIQRLAKAVLLLEEDPGEAIADVCRMTRRSADLLARSTGTHPEGGPRRRR